jgi:hypothetical protein
MKGKNKTKELTVKAEKMSPATMIELAIEKGADLEKLEKLLVLQEKWEGIQAKKVFNAEMVAVQQKMPTIAKTLKNDQTHSKYPALTDIINQAKEIYTAHGFSISFYEGQTYKTEHVRLCADVVHMAGHKESYYYDVPMDGKGIRGNANMTPIHAKSSSMSYAQRYLMCLIWNIPTGDDNDGNTAPSEYISVEELNQIEDLLVKSQTDIDKFLAWLKVESLTALPKSEFRKASVALEAKLKAKGVNKD